MSAKTMKSVIGLCLLSAQLLTFSTAFASSGGAIAGGGGNSIESNFKTKVNVLIKELVIMDSSVPGKLQFKPYEILTNMMIPNRFKPLCATNETLDFLINQQKLAYVGAPGSDTNIISLDCRPVRSREWERLFQSNETGDNLLFIHEALRNNNQSSESENDYGVSSTYIELNEAYQDKIEQTLYGLYSSGKVGKCQLYIEDRRQPLFSECLAVGICSRSYLVFKVNNENIFELETGDKKWESVQTQLADQKTSLQLMKMYKKFQCEK